MEINQSVIPKMHQKGNASNLQTSISFSMLRLDITRNSYSYEMYGFLEIKEFSMNNHKYVSFL